MRYLVALDVERLAELAVSVDAVIHVPLAIGDPVAAEAPLVLVYRPAGPIPEEWVRSRIHLARERELEGNPPYAIRMLVDIAIRSLSPAVNDPTTAVQTLDHIESLLLRASRVNLEGGSRRDANGQLRFVQEVTSWEDYVDLSLTEIQQYGAGSAQVDRRIGALLAFLLPRVPAARRAPLEQWATRLRKVVEAAPDMSVLRASVQLGDRQGLGHTALDPNN
jgi:uncharacterized membrane protein